MRYPWINRIIRAVVVSAILAPVAIFSQTASNWTATDCSGKSHELFTDLDAGKVAVIVWVMPCATCIGPALTAQDEVKTALASAPGKVLFYVADDYANTSCSTLSSWATANGITDGIVVSSSAVSMTPYGTPGMPKIIVTGGSSHQVFYNKNDPDITASELRAAIASALAVTSGIQAVNAAGFSMQVYPNPSGLSSVASVEVDRSCYLKLEIFDITGRKVLDVYNGGVEPGHHSFGFSTERLQDGSYFVRLSVPGKVLHERITIAR